MQATDRTVGRVTVLVGEKTGKYPDGNSLWIRGRDATALIDPSLSVARRAGELNGVDLVVQSHVHEDHVAGLFRFPQARVTAHRADLPGLHHIDGLLAIYGYAQPGLLEGMRTWVTEQFNYAARPTPSRTTTTRSSTSATRASAPSTSPATRAATRRC
jgi:glyoxylase-like metal-dependent hydrolase (beta-lactamase superfamily II)